MDAMAHRESLVQKKYRLRKELLSKLECAAKDSDRSVNDEIVRRLEESFRHDDLNEQFSRWFDAQTKERMVQWVGMP
jgi:hypothetical protein